jgi:hypothetical protein
MPKRILPDDVPEVGYVYISLGLDANGGPATAWDYDGISIEAAIGHLIALSDVLRDQNREDWEPLEVEESHDEDADD